MAPIDYPEVLVYGYRQAIFEENDANHEIAMDFYERMKFFLEALGEDSFPNYADPVEMEIKFQFVSPIDKQSLGFDIFVTPISGTKP